MTTLYEKVIGILGNVEEDFNAMPIEERKRIIRYTSYQQILTIWQMLNKDKNLTTEIWREKQRKWLENCVSTHQREYGDF